MASNYTVNSTLVTTTAPTLTAINAALLDQYIYLASSVPGISATLLVVLVMVVTPSLLQRNWLLLAIAVGDFFNSFAFFSSACIRISMIYNYSYFYKIKPEECLTRVYMIPYAIGGQLPQMGTCFMAFQRFLAIFCPIWYHNNWSPEVGKRLSFSITLFCTVSGCFSTLGIYTREQILIPSACTASLTFGPVYGPYDYTITIATTICGSGFTLVAILLLISKMRRKHNHNSSHADVIKMKAEANKLASSALLSVFSVILVMIPTIGYLGDSVGYAVYMADPYRFIKVLYSTNSTIAMLSYCLVNKEFRKTLVSLLQKTCCQPLFSHKIHPTSAIFLTSPSGINTGGRADENAFHT